MRPGALLNALQYGAGEISAKTCAHSSLLPSTLQCKQHEAVRGLCRSCCVRPGLFKGLSRSREMHACMLLPSCNQSPQDISPATLQCPVQVHQRQRQWEVRVPESGEHGSQHPHIRAVCNPLWQPGAAAVPLRLPQNQLVWGQERWGWQVTLQCVRNRRADGWLAARLGAGGGLCHLQQVLRAACQPPCCSHPCNTVGGFCQ